jgi:hypothetical protein
MYSEDHLTIFKDEEYNRQISESYEMEEEDERYHELKKEIMVGASHIIKKKSKIEKFKGTFEIYLCKQFNEYHVKVNAECFITSCSICGEGYTCTGKYCRGSLIYDDLNSIRKLCTYNNDLNFSTLMYTLMLNYIKNENLNFSYKNYEKILRKNIKKINNKCYIISKQILKKIQNRLNNDIALYICQFI